MSRKQIPIPPKGAILPAVRRDIERHAAQPIIVMRNADGKTYTASYGFDAKGQTVDEAVQNLRDFLAEHNAPVPDDASVMHIPNGDELESWEFAK